MEHSLLKTMDKQFSHCNYVSRSHHFPTQTLHLVYCNQHISQLWTWVKCRWPYFQHNPCCQSLGTQHVYNRGLALRLAVADSRHLKKKVGLVLFKWKLNVTQHGYLNGELKQAPVATAHFFPFLGKAESIALSLQKHISQVHLLLGALFLINC